jgi:TfoX/Sxy family transcriptional regulator of competence genes
MAWRKSSPELIAAFIAALPRNSQVERRQMFGYPAAFVNGNLFAGLHQEDVLVRLPEEQRTRLLKNGGRHWEPTPGRRMKEYLLLPVDFRPAALARWLKHSFAYAASLRKPRPKAANKSSATSTRRTAARRKKGDS